MRVAVVRKERHGDGARTSLALPKPSQAPSLTVSLARSEPPYPTLPLPGPPVLPACRFQLPSLMNGAHLHLIVNHLPILGVVFGLGLALFALARREDAKLRAALGVFVLVGLSGYAAMWTGEKAEHMLEEAVPSIAHATIHEHEEMAEKAAIAGYALGAMALLPLGLSWGKALRRPLALATVAASLLVTGLMAFAGNLGGEIRHTEIVGSGTASPAAGSPDVERRSRDDGYDREDG